PPTRPTDATVTCARGVGSWSSPRRSGTDRPRMFLDVLRGVLLAPRNARAHVFEDLPEGFARDEYGAAETVARVHMLRDGRCEDGEPLCMRAERVLRSRGGARLADHVFGRGAAGGGAARVPRCLC